jgi:hypothetical protein
MRANEGRNVNVAIYDHLQPAIGHPDTHSGNAHTCMINEGMNKDEAPDIADLDFGIYNHLILMGWIHR